MRGRSLVIACSLVAACGGDKSTAPVPPQPVQLTVLNSLMLSVTIETGGVSYGSIVPGTPISLTLPAGTSAFTWTPFKFQYGDGSLVPDDFSVFSGTLKPGANPFEFTNVVDGQPYFTPRVTYTGGGTVSVGIGDNTAVHCLGTLSSPGQQQYGYYRLTPTAEVRLYPPGSNCTGNRYLFWNNAFLAGSYAAKSGFIGLGTALTP